MKAGIKRTLLFVSVGLLSALLLGSSVAGYSLYRFVHPVPIHVRGADSCPEAARSKFHLPDEVEEVYFFSNRQLRGSYYLRCRIPSAEAYAQYKAQITAGKQPRNGDEITVNPREEKHIADWWNWRMACVRTYRMRTTTSIM